MRKSIYDLLLWSGALAGGGSGGGDTPSGGEEWIGDGNTHIWITLPEERKSPVLGVGVNGTVTVDWGDGTTPDVLTGTNITTVVNTPNHNYASAGDYVITLTVDGACEMLGNAYAGSFLLRYNSSTAAENRNTVYQSAIKKIELGDSTSIGTYSISRCFSLTSISIPNGITSISDYAFTRCYGLASINIPDGVTSIGKSAFYDCHVLQSINIPDSVTSIGSSMFHYCYGLKSINIPDGVTSIGNSTFQYCHSLTSIIIPKTVTSIGSTALQYGYSLAKIRFEGATPPTVASSNAFANIPTDCIISVPVGSLDAYKTATNYPDPATYTYVEE